MRISPRALVLLVGLLFLPDALRAAPVHQWSKRFGDAREEECPAVATDGSGNVFIAGLFYGTVNFGGGILTCDGSQDIFLAKFDMAGNHIWSKRFGNVGRSGAMSVATDGLGNVCITGYSTGSINFGGGNRFGVGEQDVFVAKFDAAGNHIWSNIFGAGSLGPPYFQLGYDVAMDGSGNALVTGYCQGGVDFGGGPLSSAGQDVFIAKFDPSGNHLWSKSFGDANSQTSYSLAIDGSGDVVIAGEVYGSVNFGGGLLTSAGDADIFLARFDAAGNHLWSRRYGDGAYQIAFAVAIDGSNGISVTGPNYGTVDLGGGPLASTGSSDAFIAKLDAAGNHSWSRSFGDPSDQAPRSIASVGNETVVTGYFRGTIDFGGGILTSAGHADIFITRFDASGYHLWSRQFGDAGSQVGLGVATDGFGGVIVAGIFSSTVDFGGGPLASASTESDIFLVRLADEATVPVLITSFEATLRKTAVSLRWDVWSDEDIESFSLYRREDAAALPIMIAEKYNASTRSYIDANVKPGNAYHYELVVHTRDGGEFRSPIVTAQIPSLTTSLDQNVPNPFNPETSIPFSLSREGRVTLRIYDASGRFVATLLDENRGAGEHVARWDGRDARGRASSSGVYFVRLESNGATQTRKLVLLK